MTNRPFIPLGLDDISADYLTTALRQAGVLRQGAVVSFDMRVVGAGSGFLGEVAEIDLTYTGDVDKAPARVIVKIPTPHTNRQVGQTLGVYEREIRFYQELRPALTIRTPQHYFSAMDVGTDPAETLKALKVMDRMPLWLIRLLLPIFNWINGRKTWHYVLMIEHLGGYRIGDQVGGCSNADAQRVMAVMARLHAGFWNSSEVVQYPWLIPFSYVAKPAQMLYRDALPQFLAQFGSELTPHQLQLLDWLKHNYFKLMAAFERRPKTLVHGDFRLDNLCFDDASGEVILFDWQTLGVGAVGFDLAYFLSALPVAHDDAAIARLIGDYHAGLDAAGITVSLEALQWEYHAGLLAMLHRLVPATFQDMIQFDGRGDEVISTWQARLMVRLTTVDPVALLAAIPQDSDRP